MLFVYDYTRRLKSCISSCLVMIPLWFSSSFVSISTPLLVVTSNLYFPGGSCALRPILSSFILYRAAAVVQSVRAFASHLKGWMFESQPRPKSLKQGDTFPLLNAQRQVGVTRVLGDYHYKEIPRVELGVTR